MLIAGILTCIFRNGGAYVILPALVVLIFVVAEKKRIIFVLTMVTLISNYGLNTALMNKMELTSDNQVEMYNIPLQQTARFVRYYEDELTEDDKETIDAIVEYTDIGKRYNPQISDYVKNQ